MPSLYRVSADLVLERFTGAALIVLASRDRFLTVNQSAADVLTCIQHSFRNLGFSIAQLAVLLRTHYSLGKDQALREAGDIVAAWTQQGILIDCQTMQQRS